MRRTSVNQPIVAFGKKSGFGRWGNRVPRHFLYILIVFLAGSPLRASTAEERHAAIERALNFIYRTASDDANFSRYGSDMLWCFYSISHTARDPQLAVEAAGMGRELARRWRRQHQHVRAEGTATEIYLMILGSYSADRLGLPDRQLKRELSHAALRFKAKDYLGFDPAQGPPALDDPKRFDTFTDALIHSYFGDAYGVPLGAHYRDVVRWLPHLRPFDGYDDDIEFDAFYTVTHAIYTLDRYHEKSIAASLLPDEFSFLRRRLEEAVSDEDPEMVAEALDCLKAAGLENDPQVGKGMDYLISSQRSDGSWAGDDGDTYTAYHSAWAGIDGLRDYRYRGQVKSLPWR